MVLVNEQIFLTRTKASQQGDWNIVLLPIIPSNGNLHMYNIKKMWEKLQVYSNK